MKKLLLKTLPALLAVLTMAPQQVRAQDNFSVKGYANVWFDIKAAPQGGGKVFASTQQAGLKAWRDEMSLKQPIGVSELMGVDVIVLFLYAQPAEAEGYNFAGWYLDNGDGVFDVSTDEFVSNEAEHYLLAALDDDKTVYDTQSAALGGQQPGQSEGMLFAYFTRGATVGVSYYQDDALSHANCGSVFIDKLINEPGDEVTLRALPNDGFQFEYWSDKFYLGQPVSRENPYTFTVKGGEHLYAYFTAIDAPEYELPAEGGFKTLTFNSPWLLSDEAVLNGAHVLVMEAEDLTRTADGKVYLDMGKEDAWVDVTQWHGAPTILYGKGKVRFSFKLSYGMARQNNALVKYSGATGVSVGGDVTYVYAFIDDLGAFVEIGNTDNMVNPDAPTSVYVPAGLAYFSLPAFDLTDDQGNIPTVIGLSPETYDRGIAGRDHALEVLAAIDGVRADTRTIRDHKVYTLSGLRLKKTPERGVYIVNGKKMVLK